VTVTRLCRAAAAAIRPCAASAVFCCLVLAGCQASAPKPVPPPSDISTAELSRQAEQAFAKKLYAQSELFHARLLERKDLAKGQRPAALQRLAASALEARHPRQARDALQAWAELDKRAAADAEWNRIYVEALAGLDSSEGLDAHLDWVLKKPDMPWESRKAAAAKAADVAFKARQYPRGLAVLDSFYRVAPDAKARAGMEKDFRAGIERLRDSELGAVVQAAPADKKGRFPYVLARFEQARREAAGKEPFDRSWSALRAIAANADLADKLLIGSAVMQLETRHGSPKAGIVLALPLTGRYQDIGRKMARGANAAQLLFAKAGLDLDVKIVNTETPGWIERIQELPDHYSIVGGPVRVEAFKELAARGALAKRAHFAFLPELGDVPEGKAAWRFFPSSRDQVRELVDFAAARLGIKALAVLSPDEKFGAHMAKLFAEEAAARGAQLTARETYPPGDHPQWGRKVARLLKVPEKLRGASKAAPVRPTPSFGAIFLPDGWTESQLLISNFFFYEADQIVFLGTELWSRYLDAGKDVEDQYFRLAVCPGAWWPESSGARLLQQTLSEEGQGNADFWVALGFDFLRFARQIGQLPSGFGAETLNPRLSRAAASLDFSMAPISFDQNGVARQMLYLFSPQKEGKALADPEAVAKGVERAKARKAKRVEAYKERVGREKAAAAVKAQEAAAEKAPAARIVDNPDLER
jgi:hypothetical protein